ncbi:MAG: hypothetical protein RI924_464 [Bacteroidota bacterium]|jgi:hypothetical protein
MKKISIYLVLVSSILCMVSLSWVQSRPFAGKESPELSTDTIRPKFPPRDTTRRTERIDTTKWKRKVDTTTAVIGRKTKETSAKVLASLKDCSLKNVKGPKGETVYVDEYDRRYYINKEGNKIFMKRPNTK